MSKKKKSPSGGVESPERIARAETVASELLRRDPDGDAAAGLLEPCRAGDASPEAVIEALVRMRSREALNLLCRLAAGLKDKALAKTARRAVYRLEQQGLAPDPEIKARPRPIVQPADRRQPIGFLGSFDFMLSRLGALAVPSPTTGLDAAMFVIDQDEGLHTFSMMAMSAGQFKRALKTITPEESHPLVEVPAGHLRYLLAEAVARARKQGRSLPRDYRESVGVFSALPLPERPIIYDLVPEVPEPDREWLEAKLPQMLEHKRFKTVFLTERLDPYIRMLDEVDQGVLIVSEGQKSERRQAILDQAARETFDADRTAVWKRVLEETALLFWLDGEQGQAVTALSAARDMEREALPNLRSPVFGALVRHLLDIWTSTPGGPEAGDQEERPVSESGLILP
ncbi:MAG: hypothetical protein KKB20_19085 [Proteobacteria bacterium]|nr:hypothetical protein [Pseudomonadota bacterium]